MTQYNMLNITLSNSQLNKLKPGLKNGTETALSLSSDVIGNIMMKLIYYINCH